MRTGKIHSKIADFFNLKVPKLVNLPNRCGEKSEIINSSPCKKRKKLLQDQEKIINSNKNQIEPKQNKPKLNAK